MMKKLLLIAVLMVSTVIFNSGCEKEKVAKSIVEQTESETVSKSIPFPEHIEQVLSDKIHVNAKIEIPEVCKSGKGTKIKLSQNSFWDNSDQIKEILLNGQKMKEEYVNEYDNWKEKVYITNNDTSLFIRFQYPSIMFNISMSVVLMPSLPILPKHCIVSSTLS